ncbi:MAG: helix-turn-helix domain-containing protein [Candidatus Micrarchaeota archaeon]
MVGRILLRSAQKRESKQTLMEREREADEVEELCRMLNLVSGRDTDKTVVEVFRNFLREFAEEKERGVGSSELARVSGINRITCIHHLVRLERAGVVVKEGTRYYLRGENVEDVVEEMRTEVESMFREFEEMAKQIDMEFMKALKKAREKNGRR